MKNTVLRFLSIIISFILIISVLASCANNENDKQTIASVTDTVTNEVEEDVHKVAISLDEHGLLDVNRPLKVGRVELSFHFLGFLIC